MKIALHCGTLRGFGSGLVGRHILRNLPRHEPHDEFLAWIPEEWSEEHGITQASVPDNVTLRFTNPGMSQKLKLENWTIRRALKTWGADVLFSTTDTTLVGCPVPHVLLVHQANLAYGPKERGYAMSRSLSLRWQLMERYLALGLPTVTLLTVQTHAMARRLSERFSFPRERIRVIPSAVAQGEASPEHLTRLASAPPFITYVASPSAHKNFSVLAPMMARVSKAHPLLQCRLTVRPEQVPELVNEAQRLGVTERFVFEGQVSHGEAMALLRRALVLVMPSTLESFGLPYYEAMAQGTPVVAADRDFAREACGDAGRYAQEDSPEAFATEVTRLVSDASLRTQLESAALKRFAEISEGWHAITAQYRQLLSTARHQVMAPDAPLALKPSFSERVRQAQAGLDEVIRTQHAEERGGARSPAEAWQTRDWR